VGPGLDTSYIAKFYFNKPGSPRVRKLVHEANALYSSLWALAEFHAVIHRRIREGASSPSDARDLASRFSEHVAEGLWNLIPVAAKLKTSTKLCCGEPAP
jgi:predicted nucleic acid-binding protein